MLLRNLSRSAARRVRWLSADASVPPLVADMRTHDCGSLRAAAVGDSVSLAGWVSVQRMYGKLLFVSLRDASGVTQLVYQKEDDVGLFEAAAALLPESVVRVAGSVRARPGEMMNGAMPTGEVEVEVRSLEVLNAPVRPVALRVQSEIGRHHGNDEARLRHRHLDLRGVEMQRNLLVRSRALGAARRALSEE